MAPVVVSAVAAVVGIGTLVVLRLRALGKQKTPVTLSNAVNVIPQQQSPARSGGGGNSEQDAIDAIAAQAAREASASMLGNGQVFEDQAGPDAGPIAEGQGGSPNPNLDAATIAAFDRGGFDDALIRANRDALSVSVEDDDD